MKHLWNLNKDLVMLNHGSFGATPKQVLEYQRVITERVEENPCRFFVDEYPTLIREAAGKCSEVINVNPNQLAFIDNATTGTATVFNHVVKNMHSGDAIMTSAHCYPAVLKLIKHTCEQRGLELVIADFPLCIDSEEQIMESIKSAFKDNVKFAVFDHVSSVSAIKFPVEQIVEYFRAVNVPLHIDGAHAPGYLELDLGSLRPDFYTGNWHKWMLAPKGSAMLYVDEKYINDFHPLAISHDYGNGFAKEFDWCGTKNPSPWLATSLAIEFCKNNVSIERNNKMAQFGADLLTNEFGFQLCAPHTSSGAMKSMAVKQNSSLEEASYIRKKLLNEHNIELFVSEYKGTLIIRISAQAYNQESDYEYLAETLKHVL